MAKTAKITVPTETPLLVEARARLRQARAFREEAQVKHQQALDLYRSQSAGTRSTITAADVDKLALEIGPLIDAEEEAEAAYRQAYADHHAEATRSLKAPLAGFQRELVEAYRNGYEHPYHSSVRDCSARSGIACQSRGAETDRPASRRSPGASHAGAARRQVGHVHDA